MYLNYWIRQVFGNDGTVKIYNCLVHTRRNFMTRILNKDSKVYEEMSKALYARSKSVCDESLLKAINLCKTNELKNYILDNWTKTSDIYSIEKWAMWARQHSPILLQHNTTNAVEVTAVTFQESICYNLQVMFFLTKMIFGIIFVIFSKKVDMKFISRHARYLSKSHKKMTFSVQRLVRCLVHWKVRRNCILGIQSWEES